MNRQFMGARAGAIRRHNLSAILAQHDDHIAMFDLPLLHSRSLAASNSWFGPKNTEERKPYGYE
jgi:hypothetical protein